MTRKQRRGALIAGGVGILGLATILVLFALRDGVVFFYTPAEVATKGIKPGTEFRLGGLVLAGSVNRGTGTKVSFSITDTKSTIPVSFDGILPDLFREGQGVIALGRLDGDNRFIANSVLAKHDETYMPPEVAKALKEQGVWQGEPVVKRAKQ
jgi:cytochrome c-type biogenesis protein CcmE